MRALPSVLAGVVLLALEVVLVLLLPHRSTPAFWTAFALSLVVLALATIVMPLAPPARDFTVWLPAWAAVVVYALVAVGLVVLSGVMSLMVVLVVHVVVAAVVALVVLSTWRHAMGTAERAERYAKVEDRFTPTQGGF